MNIVYLILGIFLLNFAIVDLLWTTLWVDGGAGPISSRMTTWIWRGLKKLGGRNSRTLSLAGPIILITTLFVWVGLIWAGWTFIFAGDQESLFDTRDEEPVTWIGRIYFVSFTMFTMGNGDFSPTDGIWQLVTSLTTASGMLFVTMGVSYVLSVLGAVTLKRSFASAVTGLGVSTEAFVRSGWNGRDLSTLDLPLSSLASQLTTLTEQHKAYPILHYYHSEKAKNASALAVAILDEALTILRFTLPEDTRPNTAILEGARATIGSYLETLHNAFIQPAEQTPPPPELERLRTIGIPVADDETMLRTIDELAERRAKLLGMLEADAWYWPPIRKASNES